MAYVRTVAPTAASFVGALVSRPRRLGCLGSVLGRLLGYTASAGARPAARSLARGKEVTEARGLWRFCAVGPSYRRGQSRATATTAAQECPRCAERHHG
eukprot:scaffold65324_cov54-Phaeocystis_antarctica.AAC.2